MCYFEENMNFVDHSDNHTSCDVTKVLRNYVTSQSSKSPSKNSLSEHVAYNGTLHRRNTKLSKLDNGYKHVKQGDCLSDGVNSKFLYRHNIRVGTRSQKWFKSNYLQLAFYYKYKRLFDSYNLHVDRSIIVSGCFHTNKKAMQKVMTPELGIFSDPCNLEFINRMAPHVKTMLRKLPKAVLPSCSRLDMLSAEFDFDTYPGFHMNSEFGLRSKGDAARLSMRLANRINNRIESKSRNGEYVKRGDLKSSIYYIGARNKRDYDYDDGDAISSRAVHMPELHNELTIAPWIDSINDYFTSVERGPVYLGNSIRKYDRLSKDISDSSFILEGDWKGFDSTIYSNMLIIAISVLRTYFKTGSKRIDNHFINIFNHTAIKDYYFPGGYIHRLYHGIPSGTKSTSVLNTIINLLCLCYCTQDYDSKYVKFVVGGDDFLISFTNLEFSEEVINTIKLRSKELGMNIKFLNRKFVNSVISEENACFYKYAIYNDVPYVPTKALLERVFCPFNHHYKTDSRLLKFFLDLIPSLGFPMSNCIPLYLVIVNLYRKVHDTPEYSVLDVVRYHFRIYNLLRYSSLESTDKRSKAPIYLFINRRVSTLCNMKFKYLYD